MTLRTFATLAVAVSLVGSTGGSAGAVTVSLDDSISGSAGAVTADLAKKCRAMMTKAYPPAVAGSKQGTAREQRDYFQKCLANNGQMENQQPTR